MTPEFQTLTLPEKDQPRFDLRRLAAEEFSVAAKAFFAPFYVASLAFRMLRRHPSSRFVRSAPLPSSAAKPEMTPSAPVRKREASLSG
jgi:hypothetical protein